MKLSPIKKIGYRLYGILYTIFRLLPVRSDMVYFIMTHDSSSEGNCGVMRQYFETHPQDGRPFCCECLTRSDTLKGSFIFRSALILARSRYVFTDNAFLPLAYLKLRKGTVLVQLWHGTGTIKKFGQHVNEGELKALEARCGRNISYVTVSSAATRDIYAECFAVPADRVLVNGLPRTDALFDAQYISDSRAVFEKRYPKVRGRRLILYAPTFRDDPTSEDDQLIKIRELAGAIIGASDPDICLALRLHPSLSDSLKASFADLAATDSIIDVSSYPCVNTLLCSTDILITDYSSIIFEYSLLRRPMLFYAYDLEHFTASDRGFYRDYEAYVPGPVCLTSTAVAEALRTLSSPAGVSATSVLAAPDTLHGSHSLDAFIADSFAYTDGRSAERLYDFITSL